mgnify:FL=1
MSPLTKLKSLLTHYTHDSLIHQNLVFIFSFSEHIFNQIPYEAILSESEQTRLHRYRIDSARYQFCITRVYLRFILAHFLQTSPQAISFEKTIKGKLFIPSSDLSFSVSHSHSMGVLTLSTDSFLGIDIEYIKPNFAYHRIANRYFTPLESQWLNAQPLPDHVPSFFNIWTGKESVSKATGLGLSIDFSSFSVIPIHSSLSTTLSNRSSFSESDCFYLHYISTSPDYSCCLASESPFKEAQAIILSL